MQPAQSCKHVSDVIITMKSEHQGSLELSLEIGRKPSQDVVAIVESRIDTTTERKQSSVTYLPMTYKKFRPCPDMKIQICQIQSRPDLEKLDPVQPCSPTKYISEPGFLSVAVFVNAPLSKYANYDRHTNWD